MVRRVLFLLSGASLRGDSLFANSERDFRVRGLTGPFQGGYNMGVRRPCCHSIEVTMAEPAKAYVMCGAPGAGKSTFVGKLLKEHPDALVVCGDNIREELYGDASIQGHYPDIQRRMVEMIQDSQGRVVIMDGTHYLASYRKTACEILRDFGYTEIELVVVDLPLETCLTQNAARDRKVPEEVIERMHKSLAASLSNVANERFARVTFV